MRRYAKNGGGEVSRRANELLKMIAAIGKEDRFLLREVTDRPATYSAALDLLIDRGLVVQVSIPGCRWHYQVTASGKSAIAAGAIPKACDDPGNCRFWNERYRRARSERRKTEGGSR